MPQTSSLVHHVSASNIIFVTQQHWFQGKVLSAKIVYTKIKDNSNECVKSMSVYSAVALVPGL